MTLDIRIGIDSIVINPERWRDGLRCSSLYVKMHLNYYLKKLPTNAINLFHRGVLVNWLYLNYYGRKNDVSTNINLVVIIK